MRPAYFTATSLLTATLCFFIVMAYSQTVLAQDPKPQGLPATIPQSLPGSSFPTQIEESNGTEADSKKEEEPIAKTAMRLYLNEPTGEKAALRAQTAHVAQRKTVIESVLQGNKTVNIPRQVTAFQPQRIEVVTHGAVLIDCDDVDLQVKLAEAGSKSFAFEIKDQLVLRYESTIIEASSAKLAAGKLTLTDASIISNQVKMTSAELVMNLEVENLRIGNAEPTGEIPSLQPTPFPGGSDGGPFGSNSTSFAPVPNSTPPSRVDSKNSIPKGFLSSPTF